jgi:four helix bundle protein
MQNAKCKMANGGNGQRQRNIEAFADRLLNFAVRAGRVVNALPDTRLGRHVAGQLVRCGTSPVPNYEEACGAESRRDFAHKMRICLKELRESRAWLRLIVRAGLLKESQMSGLVDESDQLSRIFGQSVLTARSKVMRPSPASVETEES